MGITINNFFENIYSVIFSPRAFFERKDIVSSVRLAIATVTFVAFVAKFSSAICDGSITSPFFLLSLLFFILGAIFIWFLSALFFEYVAKIFNQSGKLNKVLFYTAFAPIPCILSAPLILLKDFSVLGYVIGANVEFLLYLWVIILYAYALRAAYELSLARSFMLIFLPFISVFFAINWAIGFFSKVWYIFSM